MLTPRQFLLALLRALAGALVCAQGLWGGTLALAQPVVVAVVDSGVRADEPLLFGVLLPGYDMVSSPFNVRGGRSTDASPDSPNESCTSARRGFPASDHGTEVAKILAAEQVRIVPVKVHGRCQIGRADLLTAIAWSAGLPVAQVPANPHPARIINLSLSGTRLRCGADLQAVINRVRAAGVFVVAAAGNSHNQPLTEPANCEGVIAVGAVDAQQQLASYSALDARTEVYASGDLRRTLLARQTTSRGTLARAGAGFGPAFAANEDMGTSFAAPVVAGYLASWVQGNPGKTLDDFRQVLQSLDSRVDLSSRCEECGSKALIQHPMTR